MYLVIYGFFNSFTTIKRPNDSFPQGHVPYIQKGERKREKGSELPYFASTSTSTSAPTFASKIDYIFIKLRKF